MNIVTKPTFIGRGSRTSLISNVGEWFFVLFLFAGYYKADPRLAFVQRHIDITLLFLILSFLVFFHRALRKSFALKISNCFIKVAALFLLLAACLFGGLLYTQSWQYGFNKALRFIFLTGWAFFGAGLLVTDILSLGRFSWALATISTVMAVDALSNYPGAGKIAFVTALGSNYIGLARACGLGLLTIMFFLLPTGRKPTMKLSLVVMATLQLWAMLASGARGPVISFALSLLLIFLIFVLSLRLPYLKIDRFALRLGLVTVLTVVVLAAVGQELFPTLVYRVQVLLTEGGKSVLTRFDLWRSAIKLWAISPIWGNGAGQFAVAVTGHDVREYPHNIILELGAEIGLVGVLVFVTMIGVAFTRGFRYFYYGKGLAKIAMRYLLVASFFVLFNAMVSGDINDNRVLFSTVALLSAVPPFQQNLDSKRVIRSRPRRKQL